MPLIVFFIRASFDLVSSVWCTDTAANTGARAVSTGSAVTGTGPLHTEPVRQPCCRISGYRKAKAGIGAIPICALIAPNRPQPIDNNAYKTFAPRTQIIATPRSASLVALIGSPCRITPTVIAAIAMNTLSNTPMTETGISLRG